MLKDVLKEVNVEADKSEIPTKEQLKIVMEARRYDKQEYHKQFAKWLEEIYAEKGYKLTSKERIAVLEIETITQANKQELSAKAIEKLIQDVQNIKKCFYMIYIILTLLALLGLAIAIKSR